MENRRHFWGLLACVNLVLLVFTMLRPALSDAPLNWLAASSNIVMGAITLSLAMVRRVGYHSTVVVVLVVLIVVELAAKF